MAEPRWLTRPIVELIHFEQLAEHGGRRGIRDENLLESAIGRPRHLWSYKSDASLTELAASLCIGLVRDHPFVDGNKRTGFLATYAFLSINGFELTATEDEAASTIDGVASGTFSESELATWLAAHTRPL
ncbi:MAG TPA: type II toxin-antitoxin system death-on-curing family toxin [Candidatus Binatia bacterium]|nr:type II toxin-antitoxin system death-on-curing family toxin [Candidatus Binatia bacterium]